MTTSQLLPSQPSLACLPIVTCLAAYTPFALHIRVMVHEPSLLTSVLNSMEGFPDTLSKGLDVILSKGAAAGQFDVSTAKGEWIAVARFFLRLIYFVNCRLQVYVGSSYIAFRFKLGNTVGVSDTWRSVLNHFVVGDFPSNVQAFM